MNFLLGGRMGDLIHALYTAKNTPGRHNLFITDRRDLHSDGFLLPLQETYEELLPILSSQEYVESFEIFDNQFTPSETDGSNLSMWRRYAYSACWTELLAKTFNVPAVGGPWIKWEKDSEWSNKAVVHQSVQEARKGKYWNSVIGPFKHQCVFVGNEAEYKAFGLDIDFYKPQSLSEHFTIINSCAQFIGNQSAPLAIAHSLDALRIAMLNDIDYPHYAGEEKYSNNFTWIR